MTADNPTVSTQTLCEALRLTKQRVSQLEKAGVLVKQARGKWQLLDNIGRYIDYLKRGPGADDWREARTRNLNVRTEREELALHRDRLVMKAESHDGALDRIFWELLVKHFDFACALTADLEAAGLIAGKERATMQTANAITEWIAGARQLCRSDLAEFRKGQIHEQVAEIDDAINAAESN